MDVERVNLLPGQRRSGQTTWDPKRVSWERDEHHENEKLHDRDNDQGGSLGRLMDPTMVASQPQTTESIEKAVVDKNLPRIKKEKAVVNAIMPLRRHISTPPVILVPKASYLTRAKTTSEKLNKMKPSLQKKPRTLVSLSSNNIIEDTAVLRVPQSSSIQNTRPSSTHGVPRDFTDLFASPLRTNSRGHRSSGKNRHYSKEAEEILVQLHAKQIPRLPTSINLDNYGLWPFRKGQKYEEHADLEIAHPKSSQPRPISTCEDVDETREGDSYQQAEFDGKIEDQPKNSQMKDTSSKKIDSVANAKAANLQEYQKQLNGSDHQQEKDNDYLNPRMKRRQHLSELYDVASTRIQRKLFDHWSHIENKFNSTQGSLHAKDISSLLRRPPINANRLQIRNVSARISSVLQDMSFCIPEDPETDNEAIFEDTRPEYDNNAPCINLPNELERAKEDNLRQQRIQNLGIAVDPFGSTSNSALSGKNNQPSPKTISLETFKKAIYPDKNTELIWAEEKMRLQELREIEEIEKQEKLKEIAEAVKIRQEKSARAMKDTLAHLSPLVVWEDWSKRDATISQFMSTILPTLDYKNRREFPSVTTVQKALKDQIFTKGHLSGMHYREAGLVLHDHAAQFLQLWMRRLRVQRMFTCLVERDIFLTQMRTKHSFLKWRIHVESIHQLRQHAWWHFKQWRGAAKRAKKTNASYLICFWPFYVWKRDTRKKIYRRGKCIFLTKLANTVYLIHFFDIFRRKIRKFKENRLKIHEFQNVWQKKHRAQQFQAWSTYTKHLVQISQVWRTKGQFLQKYYKWATVKSVLIMWRYWTLLQIQIERQSNAKYLSILNPACEVLDHPLTRLLDTSFGSKIKRRTQLHEVGMTLHSKAKQESRRQSIGKAIFMKRVGKRVLHEMKAFMIRKKQGRFASYVGSLCRKNQAFARWMQVILYKMEDQEEETKTEEEMGETRAFKYELQWKQDLLWRTQGIENTAVERNELKRQIEKTESDKENRWKAFQQLQDRMESLQDIEKRFLTAQYDATLKAREQIQQFGAQILRTRGRRLHDSMVQAISHLENTRMGLTMQMVFRCLRLPISELKTRMLYNRAKLKNWIRICKRREFLYHQMPLYHRLRMKWRVWKSWMGLIQHRFMYETPGLMMKIHRQRELLRKYDQFLVTNDVINSSAYNERGSITNHFHPIFLRWVEYTQLSINYKKMVVQSRKKAQVRFLQRALHSWMYQLKPMHTWVHRQANHPMMYQRAASDCQRIHSYILVLRKRLMSYRLRRLIAWIVTRVRRKACTIPNMKRIFYQQTENVKQRLLLESRLMFVMYNDRKIHHYEESWSEFFGSKIGAFFETRPAPAYSSIHQIVVVCGEALTGLTVQWRNFAGLNKPHEMGGAIGEHEAFTFEEDEHLVMMEGYAGHSIYGLRFGTSKKRLSRWFGRADRGQYFQVHANVARGEQIIGFHGHGTKTSIHQLGVQFRYTTRENIFANYWLKEEPLASPENEESTEHHQVTLCDRQFAYFLQLRAGEVMKCLSRAHKLGLLMWRSNTLPDQLTSLPIVVGMVKWFFHGLVHGLVPLAGDIERGKKLLFDGVNSRTQGQNLINKGKLVQESVSAYTTGPLAMSVAVHGREKIMEVRRKVAFGDEQMANGKALIQRGNELIQEGQKILPAIRQDERMRQHIHDLYGVVQTRDYIEQIGSIKNLLLYSQSSQLATYDIERYDIDEHLSHLSQGLKKGFEDLANRTN